MHRLLAWGAPTYTLTRQQWVPRSIEEVFTFFEDPYNLPRITPSWLNFTILSMEPNVIRAGTRIVYRLRWFGIPYLWRTLIAEWVEGEEFVDTQESGPYILWHHTHTFEPCQGGVFLTDCVRYRLPLGLFGALLHRILIRRQLDTIFDYRVQKIAELLSDGELFRAAPLKVSVPSNCHPS